MIRFDDWYITAEKEVIARQHDNLTRRLDIVGEIPTGWTWSLLTGAEEELNVITLEPTQNGLGVTLTAQMLSRAGYWQLQLRGIQSSPLPAQGGGLYSPELQTIRVLDREKYDALETKDPATLYLIRG